MAGGRMRLSFRYLLEPGGLAEGRALVVDEEGRIAAVEPDPGPWDGYLALPGMPNAHSHAFQRALAGRGEARRGEDSFWSWREAMYGLAESLTSEDVAAVARFAFGEMLAAGFTSVAEFHYLHHGADGAGPADMAEAILGAARDAGIRLVLLPVLYERGGFGEPLRPEQRPFSAGGLPGYLRLLAGLSARRRSEEAARDGRSGPAWSLGVAPHSLRAVDPGHLPALLEGAREVLGDAFPVHVHVSEQPAEVEACRAAHGTTPIDLLDRHTPLGARWTLVHATHATPGELVRIRAAGATTALCPLTEAWLGDGLFPAAEHVASGGVIAVGSDGNVRIDAVGELRWLEFGQRLSSGARARLAGAEGLGGPLWRRCAAGGAAALGLPVGSLEPGRFADLVVLDEDAAPWLGQEGEAVLDALVTGASRADLGDVYVGGRRVARGGNPPEGGEVRERYREVVRRVRERTG
ncbi:MAG: formimidoylglutamate deiminase [Candidatus Palauibacterales bacterium]|nr:formimidoylglutamate deiminase [Candidatus Palauibacterales bacterium]